MRPHTHIMPHRLEIAFKPDLSDAEVANSYGSGFRYLIARRYGMTMGIDIARGPEETAWYIQAGSSWR